MKNTAKDRLMKLMFDLKEREGGATYGEIADAILEGFREKSYSSRLADMNAWEEDDDGKKVCPTCHQTWYWQKLTMKKRYVDALRVLNATGKDMTFKEIAAYTGSKETYYRYFTEARHWGLIEGSGEKRKRSESFVLTQKGVSFLRGDEAINEFLWKLKGTEEVKTELDSVSGDWIYIEDVVPTDPDELNDGSLHMANGKAVKVPITQQ